MDLEKIPTVHPNINLELCRLLGIRAIEDCLEEVLDMSQPVSEIDAIQVTFRSYSSIGLVPHIARNFIF